MRGGCHEPRGAAALSGGGRPERKLVGALRFSWTPARRAQPGPLSGTLLTTIPCCHPPEPPGAADPSLGVPPLELFEKLGRREPRNRERLGELRSLVPVLLGVFLGTLPGSLYWGSLPATLAPLGGNARL